MGLFNKIYAGIAFVLLGVIVIFSYTGIRQEDKEITRSLDNIQFTLASIVSTQLEVGYFERIWPFELLNDISKNENFLFWHILNSNRDIELSSKSIGIVSSDEQDFFKGLPEIVTSINMEYRIPDSKVWIIPLRIEAGGGARGWAFCLGYSTKNLKAIFWKNLLIYLYITIGLIVLTVPITSRLTRKALQPLLLLADATSKIQNGIYDVQLPESNTKEIYQLILAYESMLGGIKQKDRKIQEQINQLNAAFMELEELNRTLERRVEERTEKLSYTNNQLKKLSKRLSIEKGKAEAANKSISAFMANMSHEIRTPLNAILGFSAVLVRREKEEKKLGMIKNITLAGETLLALINDILDLSKIEANQLTLAQQSFDLKEMLDEVFMLFSGNAKMRNIDYQLYYPNNFNFNIITDPVRLKQIIINLIGNAFKFTEEGMVHINVKVKLDKQNSVADISIDIIDSGVGIPEDQQKRIFDAFVQKKDQSVQKYGGTGLGLAISLRLANLMNGNLFIKESNPDKGSTFTLLLDSVPVEQQPNDTTEPSLGFRKYKFKKPVTLLYIDDIEINCVIFREFIAESFSNYKLIECLEGQCGLDKLETENIDIVFVDLKMPSPTGVEVTEQIRNNDKVKHLPVIALTASTEQSEHDNFKQAGGDELLLKPLQQNEIINVLKQYCEVEE